MFSGNRATYSTSRRPNINGHKHNRKCPYICTIHTINPADKLFQSFYFILDSWLSKSVVILKGHLKQHTQCYYVFVFVRLYCYALSINVPEFHPTACSYTRSCLLLCFSGFPEEGLPHQSSPYHPLEW